jgi:hypothetical protein
MHLRTPSSAPLLALLALAPAALASHAAPPAPRAAHAAVQDPDPSLAEELDRLAAAIAQRGVEDEAAIASIDRLLTAWPGLGEADRADVVDAVSACLAVKRADLDPVEEDRAAEPDRRLFLAATVALGEMGPESVPELVRWVGERRHRNDTVLRARMAASLGRTRDERMLRPLTALLEDDDAALIAAAAKALGELEGAPGEVRKKAVGELVDVLAAALKAIEKDERNVVARDRYNAFAAEIVTSLGRLARHEERDPAAWLAWWREHKRADWDEEDA